jgi:hypothetical protein
VSVIIDETPRRFVSIQDTIVGQVRSDEMVSQFPRNRDLQLAQQKNLNQAHHRLTTTPLLTLADPFEHAKRPGVESQTHSGTFHQHLPEQRSAGVEKTTNALELIQIECENRGNDRKPFMLKVSRQVPSRYQPP